MSLMNGPASAAFTKAASLRRLQPAAAAPLLNKLEGIWTRVLPDSDAQGMVNVLWACGKLNHSSPQLWSSTLAAYLEKLQQRPQLSEGGTGQNVANIVYALALVANGNQGNVPGVSREEVTAAVEQMCSYMRVLVTHPDLKGVNSQNAVNTLWDVAKLRINPGDAALNSLLQAMARPALREAAEAQHLSNMCWAVSELQGRCGWQPQQQQLWQRLLSEQQLAVIAAGSTQEVSTVALALARIVSVETPVISLEFAQQCTQKLLRGATAQDLSRWNDQDVGNAMWACAKLAMQEEVFFERTEAAAAAGWPQQAASASLAQMAYACGTLQLQLPQLMAQVVERAETLLSAKTGRRSAGLTSKADKVITPATIGWAVAVLNMQPLAARVRELVASCVHPRSRLTGQDVRMLGVLHCWLAEQQLLDGKGLAGVLTPEQLAACESRVRGTAPQTALSSDGQL
jgi:hypothetical protein